MTTPYHVEVNEIEGFIRISRHSREMLYWDSHEWEEESELVFTIATAINVALTNPTEMDKKMKKMGKIT